MCESVYVVTKVDYMFDPDAESESAYTNVAFVIGIFRDLEKAKKEIELTAEEDYPGRTFKWTKMYANGEYWYTSKCKDLVGNTTFGTHYQTKEMQMDQMCTMQ